MLPDHTAQGLCPDFAAPFAAALMNPTHATPIDVVGPRGKSAIKRYNVYRNNVTVSLIDALAACRTDVFVVRQPLWFGRSMLTWEA
jgi:hypothetical protein